ncbi:putative DNA repair protein [Xylogone sp. PMI_703]|nr:putative DNA repair protein [Xylogone sp. PMI_703]
MSSKVFKDDAFRVADSTDWLPTPLASLAPVDSALRCQVCKDFYETPMMTSCSHTFCSLCIRRCLNNDGKCPACRTPDQELKLRSNLALEDIVEAFKNARPKVLEYAEKPVQIRSASPKRTIEEAGLEQQGEDQPRKRTRSAARKTYAPAFEEEPIAVDEEDGDEDYIPEDGMVTCPICQGRVKMEQINPHLDRCDGNPPNTKQKVVTLNASTKPTKRPERLPHLSYSMYKENALRKKLSELGISSTGPRQLLERRHTEWITLWNANCDSKNPRSKQELKHDLEVWERTQGGRAPTVNASSNPGSNIASKDFDGAAWASKHEGSFQQLIAEARKKRAAKQAASESPGASGSNETRDDLPANILRTPINNSDDDHQDATETTNHTLYTNSTTEVSAPPDQFWDAPASPGEIASAIPGSDVRAAENVQQRHARSRFFEELDNNIDSPPTSSRTMISSDRQEVTQGP